MNPADLSLVIIGAIVMMIGLFRITPPHFNKSFILMNGPLVLMLIVATVIAARSHTDGIYTEWLGSALAVASRFIPLLTALFLVMGIGGILARIYQTEIQSFILAHRVTGPVIAALLTPTSNSLIPIVEKTWAIEPSLRPMCVYYLQASALMGVPLFMLRQMGFSENTGIAPRMYIAGCIMAVCTLPFSSMIYKFADLICSFCSKIWPTF